MHGVVVRGVAGRRESYRPVESRLCTTADPLDVAHAFRSQLGIGDLYVADLDAILAEAPNRTVWQALADAGFTLWIDAGIRSVEDAKGVLESGAGAVVVGLETLPGPSLLQRLCVECTPERVVFSLDLKAGRPMGELASWRSPDPFRIAEEAVETGVRRLIVLDLAGVGVSAGPTCLDLCRRLRTSFPELELITGGGVRGMADLEILRECRIDGALVATALHQGSLTREEIDRLRSGVD